MNTNQPRVWWCNQGDSYEGSIKKSYLWTPKKSGDGRTIPHWQNLEKSKRGDIIIHYANPYIRALSQIVGEPEDAQEFYKYKGEMTEGRKRMIDCIIEFDDPVDINFIPLEIKKRTEKIFDKDGKLNQGYLFEAKENLLNFLKSHHLELREAYDLLHENYRGSFSDIISTKDTTVSTEQFTEVSQDLASIEDDMWNDGISFPSQEDLVYKIISATKRKKNVILYGPPGTGKTYLAESVSKHLAKESSGETQTIQFHPSYSYEDFVQGIRPVTHKDGSFSYKRRPGDFIGFCKKARADDKDRLYILVVDEINRANLSQVFGELMYLLEYRNSEIKLAGSNKTFSIPENVRIIGTMNTADRSIALIDRALRRRFAFIRIEPNYDVVRQYHDYHETGCDVEDLIKVLQEINQAIDDRNYELGISYFLTETLEDDIADIWEMEIEPYLEEYFFDNPDRVEEFRWEKVKDRIGIANSETP